ncbi:MAG: ABC transporter ATP-binding protein [Clostridiales bacterium]|nr:ABC transporter ATP-binding protein [Candidatus Apopatocola equi]
MIKKFVPYLKEFKKQVLLMPVFMLLEVAGEMILPLLIAGIIDKGINGGGGLPVIMPYSIGMIVLAFVSLGCGILSSKNSAVATQGFGRNLRKALFEKVQTFSFNDNDRFSSASLITRLTNDVRTIQGMVGMAVRMVLRTPVQMIASLVICLTMNAKLTIILGVALPIMALFVVKIMKKAHALFKAQQTAIDGLNNAVQENLIAIRVVKAFVREDYERGKFKKANDDLRDASMNAAFHIMKVFPVMTLILQAATIAVYYWGAFDIRDGAMLTGELTAYVGYISRVLMSVFMVSQSLNQVTRAAACATRIIEVLDSDPDIKDGTATELPEAKGRIEFKNVSFKYRTGTGDAVLHDVSLTIEPGEFVAFMGGTGTGKSTLVNLIPRFYDVNDGQILIDGMDVRDYPIEELRSRIGMVLQKNVLFSGTIRENILWGKPDATEEELRQAARDAQAEEFILATPDGYDTFLEQGGVNVSGGQKQRLCIARAMLRHPSILILDDSTSPVDTMTEAAIRESFHKNLKDTTVVIIAQRISSVETADKIVIVDDDHIAAVGTHEELLKTSPIYQEIYQSQQEGGAMPNG